MAMNYIFASVWNDNFDSYFLQSLHYIAPMAWNIFFTEGRDNLYDIFQLPLDKNSKHEFYTGRKELLWLSLDTDMQIKYGLLREQFQT